MNPALRRLISVTVSLTFFLAAIAIFFSLIVPASGEIQDLRGQRNALSGLLEEESARIEAVRRLFDEYGSISTLESTLKKALPSDEEIPSVINQLHGMAKASGITIESLDISLPAIKPNNQDDVIRPVGEVQVSLTLSGNYSEIKSYLSSLETNVRVMDVKRLSLNGGTEGETLSYDIVVNAYYQL